MKDHQMHHYHQESDKSLSSLLDRCSHIFVHRIGSKNHGQDSILSLISQHPGMTQKELGEHLGIQPASVSELLAKLERKGLVIREKDERDRRSIRVRLTEDGTILSNVPVDKNADPFQVLSPEEQDQLQFLLQKLLADWTLRYRADHGHQGHHHHHKENHHGKHK